jgi:chromosome segregation ATPase
MDAAYEHASKLAKEVEDHAMHIKQAKVDYDLRAQSILQWEKQIQELQHKIKEAQQQQLAYESNTFGNRFEELLNKGLAETEAAEQLKGEVAILEGAQCSTQHKLESFKNIFDRLRNNTHF